MSTMMWTPWVYRGQCVAVVDGDTLDVRLDLGFNIERQVRLRLRGIDTAEIFGVRDGGNEHRRGIQHKHFVDDWMRTAEDRAETWPLRVRTYQDSTGKYGRYLADIHRRNGLGGWSDHSLVDALLAEYPEVER